MARADGYGAFIAARWRDPSAIIWRPFSVAPHGLWRVAALTAAGALVGTPQAADAAVFWSDYDSGYAMPAPVMPQRTHRVRRLPGKKVEASVKDAVKPQGPLIIAISINKQNLKVYDTNGFFAETPISTGMRGHSTPMGVFSVIQKQKYHRSNIYSGAPMPFMERITWSGIAMHAGVLPGYPASHGCIRMPMSFAVKMYGWTRMGARVVIIPGEITPANFTHPLLVTQKIAPAPVATDEVKSAPALSSETAKSDKATRAATPGELRNAERLQVGMDGTPSAVPLSEQTHTADAGAVPAVRDTVMMSDAPPSSDIMSSAAQVSDNAVPGNSPTAATVVAAATSSAATVKPGEAPEANVKTTSEVPSGVSDVNKDQGRMSDADRAAAAKPDSAPAIASKHGGPISVFISRKDAKLYVRQNFAPLFDVPVTIAPSDRPLGTHIFTAEANKTDTNILRWSVLSLPATRNAERGEDDLRVAQRRKMAGAVEIRSVPEPDSPAEALDRITIAADVMARITDALSTGGSIIVSDQGIAAGETGEGTDFILSLR
jgi:lipoprotein-anchoring transpeptidase ErfK/SrfK